MLSVRCCRNFSNPVLHIRKLGSNIKTLSRFVYLRGLGMTGSRSPLSYEQQHQVPLGFGLITTAPFLLDHIPHLSSKLEP
jgi:hypothetical protein